MAVDIKVAPDEKLELVQTYITDTNSNSDYFNISELPDTFSGGKNAFLLAGSDKLLANTEIKIQIRDSEGKVCYIEYSNGSPEYYEGNSKVVAVYVYPNTTAFGPATITILGQLKDVPQEWNGLYSVKWTKQININPALANTTRVRFYKRPQVSITEIVEPLYTIVSGSKTPSLIQGSFASIKVNQLETFAGDVKRIKVYRTALGDISDYDLIQDILVESKNLLTTYALSGSVVGDGGVFTNDSLSKLWLTGSLYGALNSTYINDGLQLTGSGALTYSSSLNLLSSNTYELQLDSFFTGSTANKLGIYVSYPTQSILGQPYTATTPIATLNGITPTKNFGTQTFPFNVPFDYPTASLYLSQDSGTTQWHVGNISLNVSQDTAFSPNEISFITSMPTVLTNETFNFKCEFYDVNNNYVPVAVTQSAVFVGGTNFNTIQSGSLYASSSVSASLAALSQSVSGTISLTSQSVSSSIAETSSSLSSSISKSASDTSASSANFIILVSGSLNDSIDLVSGSVVLLSSSLGNLSSSLLNYSASQSSQSLYQVYSASAFLDKFIYTDEDGKINTPPTASGNGLYLGSTYLGYYSQSAWRTYMDDQGDFALAGANPNAGFLAWSSKLQRLQVQGDINIQGGNAATTSSVATAAANAVTSGSNSATAVSNSLAPNIFTSTTGLINRPPSVLVGSTAGLYLGSSFLGYYNGTDWKTYMANNGNFFLSGPGTNSLSWVNGVLTISGAITVTGGNAATSTDVSTAQSTAISTASGDATSKANAAQAAAIAAAASDATTKANSARTAAELFASGIGTNAVASGSAAATAAQTAAINQAKADASASVNLLANGNWTAGSGTFITSNSISSPVIAGNAGYISSLFKVGQNGITLDGVNKKIFIGTGTFGNANTGFYADNDGNFSLGNQLTFTGGNLAIAGAASIGGTTATTIATGAAAGAAALQPGANISSLTNNSGYQDASSVNSAAKTAGSVGGWTINSTNLTSNNNRTVLYNTGYIELKDSAGQNKITIDSSPTLPSPTAGSDSGNITVPAQAAQTSYYNNGAASGDNTAVGYHAPTNTYSLQWSQQVWFTPTISGYYEFTTWFPKNDGMGATGTSGTAYMGLRAYIYDAAGNSLINEEGREYIEGPVEGAGVGATQTGFAAGTYGNQYNRNGTGAYFSNQYLQAGVAVRFLIQWIVYNIGYSDNLTIKGYWPATNVQYISNVPKTNINQQGFQVIQDTNRYLTIRPSGWYMYNDPANYGGGGAPPNLNDQGITEVTGIMGGTMVVLNATDKNDWHSSKQKQYIRSAQFSFANRAAGGNFISSFFYGGYARSFNLTRAYGWFQPNTNTGFTDFGGSWWPYAYNIESVTRISYGKFQVTFAEAVMDSYGAFYGGGIYSVFIGSRDMDGPTQFQQAGLSNVYHTGFIIDLGNETLDNRFISILVIA